MYQNKVLGVQSNANKEGAYVYGLAPNNHLSQRWRVAYTDKIGN